MGHHARWTDEVVLTDLSGCHPGVVVMFMPRHVLERACVGMYLARPRLLSMMIGYLVMGTIGIVYGDRKPSGRAGLWRCGVP